MSDIIDRFESLLKEMQCALIENDVEKVARLTELQRTQATELAESVKADAKLRDELRLRISGIQEQLEMNRLLLEQGIHLADSVIQAIVGRLRDSGESLFTYSV